MKQLIEVEDVVIWRRKQYRWKYKYDKKDNLLKEFLLKVYEEMRLDHANLYAEDFTNETILISHEYPKDDNWFIDLEASCDRNNVRCYISGESDYNPGVTFKVVLENGEVEEGI